MNIDFPPDLELRCLVAAVNEILVGTWTNDGVTAWWHQARAELDGFTPYQMLLSPTEADRQRVIWLADAGRDMIAT